jgi:hypothetical protein
MRWRRYCYTFSNLQRDILFKVTPEAMQYYDGVIQELEDKAESNNNDMLNTAIGRGQAHILKIAMLLELGKKELSTTIGIESVKIATDMVINYFLPSMMGVIDRLQEDIKNNQIEKIISVLRRLGGIASRTKVLHDSKLKSKDFIECISTMLESKTIEAIKDRKTKITYYRLLDSSKNLPNLQNPPNLLISNNTNNREILETSNKLVKLDDKNDTIERACNVKLLRDIETLGISGISGISEIKGD